MTYMNKELLPLLEEDKTLYSGFLEKAAEETERYFESFCDSPDKISVWAHHYFCKEEGGRLIYDIDSPHRHVCSICGKAYEDDLMNGAWLTMYRNEGAVSVWKAALLYKTSGDDKYLGYITDYLGFYSDNYHLFKRHNKEGIVFEEGEEVLWGCSRIMPQNLNEAIYLVRIINALEIIKEDLPDGFLNDLETKMFGPAFELIKGQAHKVHNIPCWIDCAIGVMGLFLDRKDMLDFAFKGEFNVNRQLKEGVTEDYFWYEGSIHYNCFLLEGLVNLLLFTEMYGYDFSYGKSVIENMILSVYDYAFYNHRLPNPNDGWPDVNLKTYSYLYAMATRVFGEDSNVGERLKSILLGEGERGTLPLSKPYYFENDISLEEVLFTPGIRKKNFSGVTNENRLFPASYCAMIGQGKSSAFVKFGHNGPSHAHPDKMNIELILDGTCISRDLSNSGYGNVYCNEWHRVSASHNTVVVNGMNQDGFGGGENLLYEKDRFHGRAENVYPGVSYEREVKIGKLDFSDEFSVKTPDESVCDFFFHVEGTLESELKGTDGELGYDTNGYQHLKNVRKITVEGDYTELDWIVDGRKLKSLLDLSGAELYVASSPDNPVVNYRTTLIIRKKGTSCRYNNHWVMEK